MVNYYVTYVYKYACVIMLAYLMGWSELVSKNAGEWRYGEGGREPESPLSLRGGITV